MRYILAALMFLAGSFSAAAQDAPFGLSWGPVDRIPKPSRAHREGNVTSLFYDHDRPIAAGADTEQVIVDVCKAEGLQQVVWISRRLAAEDALAKFEAARRQGVDRYGEATPLLMPHAVHWLQGRVFVGVSSEFEGKARLVMFMRGDQYGTCSAAHEIETGHGAGMHAAELLHRQY